jgi:hypothetical protein
MKSCVVSPVVINVYATEYVAPRMRVKKVKLSQALEAYRVVSNIV